MERVFLWEYKDLLENELTISIYIMFYINLYKMPDRLDEKEKGENI